PTGLGQVPHGGWMERPEVRRIHVEVAGPDHDVLRIGSLEDRDSAGLEHPGAFLEEGKVGLQRDVLDDVDRRDRSHARVGQSPEVRDGVTALHLESGSARTLDHLVVQVDAHPLEALLAEEHQQLAPSTAEIEDRPFRLAGVGFTQPGEIGPEAPLDLLRASPEGVLERGVHPLPHLPPLAREDLDLRGLERPRQAPPGLLDEDREATLLQDEATVEGFPAYDLVLETLGGVA